MYDPLTARFLQEDTYAGDKNDPLSLNRYTYCHNEPLMYSDPTGHWEIVGNAAFKEDGDTRETLAVLVTGDINDAGLIGHNSAEVNNLNVGGAIDITALLNKQKNQGTQIKGIKIGDEVYVKGFGAKSADSSGSEKDTAFFDNKKMKVVNIKPGYMFAFGCSQNFTNTITAWFKPENVSKDPIGDNVYDGRVDLHQDDYYWDSLLNYQNEQNEITYDISLQELPFLNDLMAERGIFKLSSDNAYKVLEIFRVNGAITAEQLYNLGYAKSNDAAKLINFTYELNKRDFTLTQAAMMYQNEQSTKAWQGVELFILQAISSQPSGTRITIKSDTFSEKSPLDMIEKNLNQNGITISVKNGSLTAYKGAGKTWFQKATKPSDYLNEALNRQGLKNAPNSLKEKWSEFGYDFEVRAHPADPKYGKTGSIYRVARRQQGVDANGQGYGWQYMDESGNWYHTSVLKTNNAAAEATHIQLP